GAPPHQRPTVATSPPTTLRSVGARWEEENRRDAEWRKRLISRVRPSPSGRRWPIGRMRAFQIERGAPPHQRPTVATSPPTTLRSVGARWEEENRGDAETPRGGS